MSPPPLEERAEAARDAARTAILDLVPDGVVVLEPGPTVAWINRAAERLLGVPRQEAVGRTCREVLDIRDAQGRDVCVLVPLGRRMAMAKGLPERDYELRPRGGRYFPITLHCIYDKDDAGVVQRVVCTLRDTRPRRGMDLRTVELISTVSHEIRSPLTSIKGFTKTLLDRWDRFDDELKKEMLAAVNTDADRVTRLLGELLEISRLEAGRLRLRPKRVHLGALAETLADELRKRSEQHTIDVSFPDGFPEIHADPDKIQQVLTNLIENALKYTEQGTVLVSGTVDGERVTISVSDEGEGIPSPQLPRLFKKFYRRERAGSPSGTGLGLYICKGLVEAHGGEISARSAPGRGTTFAFELPIEMGVLDE